MSCVLGHSVEADAKAPVTYLILLADGLHNIHWRSCHRRLVHRQRPADLWLLFGLAGGTLAVVALFFKALVFLSIDPDAARAAKIPVTALRYLLLTVLAATIMASIKLVGVVLVSALLVILAATGQLAAKSMTGMLAISIGSALVAVIAGHRRRSLRDR